MTYGFERLGPGGFQDLAAALAVAAFGVGIEVMGDGSDGGRDLYTRDPVAWATDEDPWVGYTVFQVKQKAELSAKASTDAAWLWGEVRAELDKWVDPRSNRSDLPGQLVFVTNVSLTPTPGSGGHDRIRQNIVGYGEQLGDASRDLGSGSERLAKLARFGQIRRIEFWDRNKLTTLLDVYAGVRCAFPGFLTASDVLAHLSDFTGLVGTADLEPALRMHARTMLLRDGLIYLAEAGYGDGASLQVHQVAIDLPVLEGDDAADEKIARGSAIAAVLDRAERVLKPTMSLAPTPRHLILKGDPGNGKTTLSKLLVQVYRAAFLTGGTQLSADQQGVIDGLAEAMTRFGRTLPKNRRWPIRVDLAEYAQERGHLTQDSLMRWIAEQVSAQAVSGRMAPGLLATWQKQWPWLVFLDGLDEVTEPQIRRAVIERVVEFVNEAEADDSDLLVVLTTRPVGYTENIAPNQFETLTLAGLTPKEALRYAEVVTHARLRNDPERGNGVLRHLEDATKNEQFANLLRTPLQVLILSIIIENTGGNLAPDRYSLFWGYYTTVVNRELAKPTSLRNLLRDHSPQIQRLHEEVGFALQVRSEAGDGSYAALTRYELRDIAWRVLHEAGHQQSPATETLLDQIVQAATQRLVLIAPRGDDGFGFDVRSLQELMAAMRLVNAERDTITRRLQTVAAHPHWRNTWLFAAGHIATRRHEHELRYLVETVENIDANAAHRLGRVVPVGPRLALSIIDEGMLRPWPLWRERLLIHGLLVLIEPSPPDLPEIARVLLHHADGDDAQRRAVADGIRAALSGSSTTRATTEAMQRLLPLAEKQLTVRSITKGLAKILRDPAAPCTPEPILDIEEFDTELATAPVSDSVRELIGAAQIALQPLLRGGKRPSDPEAIRAALSDPEGSRLLETALEHVTPAAAAVTAALRDDVLPDFIREPVGGQIL